MKRRTRLTLISAAVVALMAGGFAAAALWNARVGAEVPDVAIGAVRFGAAAETAPGQRAFSEGGAPVTVTLPGKTVIEVLDQTTIDADPVISALLRERSRARHRRPELRRCRDWNRSRARSHTTSVRESPSPVRCSNDPPSRCSLPVQAAIAPLFPQRPSQPRARTRRTFTSSTAATQNCSRQAPHSTALNPSASGAQRSVGTRSPTARTSTTCASPGPQRTAVRTAHSPAGTRRSASRRHLNFLGVYRNLATVEATAEDTTKAKASARVGCRHLSRSNWRARHCHLAGSDRHQRESSGRSTRLTATKRDLWRWAPPRVCTSCA